MIMGAADAVDGREYSQQRMYQLTGELTGEYAERGLADRRRRAGSPWECPQSRAHLAA